MEKIKTKIKRWLGITSLEQIVGKEKPKGKVSLFDSLLMSHWDFGPKNLVETVQSLRDDFNELDNKFDMLERYLQIEFYKQNTEIQVYDWADEDKKQGFRKTKPYEIIKKEKTTPTE